MPLQVQHFVQLHRLSFLAADRYRIVGVALRQAQTLFSLVLRLIAIRLFKPPTFLQLRFHDPHLRRVFRFAFSRFEFKHPSMQILVASSAYRHEIVGRICPAL